MGCTQSVAIAVAEQAVAPSGEAASRQEAPRRVGSKDASEEPPGRPDFRVRLARSPSELLGAILGYASEGAVIVCIKPEGIFGKWNLGADEEQKLDPGFIIQEVNGVTGCWDIMAELRKAVVLDMSIRATPPPHAGRDWFEQTARRGARSAEHRRGLEAQGLRPFMVVEQSPDPQGCQSRFAALPSLLAAKAGVDSCAICLADVEPDAELVQLPCRHAFHPACVAGWLRRGQCDGSCAALCPLCRHPVG